MTICTSFECGCGKPIVFRNIRGRRKPTLRKMRKFNPIPNQQWAGPGYRNLTLDRVAEDPHFKASEHSYFIQAVDAAAFALYQWLAPNKFIKKQGARNYFLRLDPVLCKVASTKDPHGIVRL